ncbi:hypothetical protein [Microcoleus sp.]
MRLYGKSRIVRAIVNPEARNPVFTKKLVFSNEKSTKKPPLRNVNSTIRPA